MKKLLILALTVIACHRNLAQEFECETDICVLKPAGKYSFVLTGCVETLQLFVFDSDFKPVNGLMISGFADFYYNDNTCRSTLIYHAKTTNVVSIKIPKWDFIIVRLMVTVGRETLSVNFENPCEGR